MNIQALAEELQEIAIRLTEIANEMDVAQFKIKTKEKKTKEKKIKNKNIVKNNSKINNKKYTNFSYAESDTELLEPDTESAENFFKNSEVKDDSKHNSKVQKILDSKKTKKPSKKAKSQVEQYEEKLEEERFSEFNCGDLVRYFRDCAESVGIRYVCNWGKDCKLVKNLLEGEDFSFTSEEVALMSNFLFLSNQTYLDKKMLSVGIFTTGWLNKIYQDSQDWVKGKYKEEKQKKDKKKRQSDWEENEVSLGKLGGE